MPDMIKIENSSNLTGYFYNDEIKKLFIEFKGGAVYVYDEISIELAAEFLKAESKGAFLAKRIKDKFNFIKYEVSEIDKTNENKA